MKSIQLFFKENLDGKYAYVSSGGLQVEGALEQKCRMDFTEYHGLSLVATVEFNRGELTAKLDKLLVEAKEECGMTYEQRDKLIERIMPDFKKMDVHIGRIMPYGVKNISTQYDKDGSVHTAQITYDNGSVVNIKAIGTR